MVNHIERKHIVERYVFLKNESLKRDLSKQEFREMQIIRNELGLDHEEILAEGGWIAPSKKGDNNESKQTH